MKYRKKPVVVEAFRWLHDEIPEWWEHGQNVKFATDSLAVFIKTLEGTMECLPGDWIIKGLAGEIYPCKHEIFEKTYEPAT